MTPAGFVEWTVFRPETATDQILEVLTLINPCSGRVSGWADRRKKRDCRRLV